MLTAYRHARSALIIGCFFGIPLLYELPFQYSSNNLSKQLSWIDNTFWGRSQVVFVKCSDIVSNHNVKLTRHIQNVVRECQMTDFFFQLCIYFTVFDDIVYLSDDISH